MKVQKLELMTVDSTKAQQMLSAYPYERQRRVTRNDVKYYATLMREGKWQPGSMIEVAYAPNGDGKPHGHLVNGQHRLLAVIESGTPVDFVVKHVECADDEELAFAYGAIDTQRARNVNDLLRALNLSEELGTTEYDNSKISAAVSFIKNDFKRANKYALTQYERVTLVREYALPAGLFFELVAGATNRMAQLLRRASTLALAMVTLDEACGVYGQDKVEKFWSGVAFDDGLHIGDPRKVANRHLIESAQRQASAGARVSAEYSSRYLANCFNAWVEGRELKHTRVPDASAPIVINGTRFKGK